MREITAFGVAEEAVFAKRAVEHADQMRQERQKEKTQKKPLTFREKEKRKRDTGKQSSGASPCHQLCAGVTRCRDVVCMHAPARTTLSPFVMQIRTMWRRRSALRGNTDVIMALTADLGSNRAAVASWPSACKMSLCMHMACDPVHP